MFGRVASNHHEGQKMLLNRELRPFAWNPRVDTWRAIFAAHDAASTFYADPPTPLVQDSVVVATNMSRKLALELLSVEFLVNDVEQNLVFRDLGREWRRGVRPADRRVCEIVRNTLQLSLGVRARFHIASVAIDPNDEILSYRVDRHPVRRSHRAVQSARAPEWF